MSMTHFVTYQKSAPTAGTRKPVLVSDASDMQFGTKFLCQFTVTVFWYGFSAPICGICVMDIRSSNISVCKTMSLTANQQSCTSSHAFNSISFLQAELTLTV